MLSVALAELNHRIFIQKKMAVTQHSFVCLLQLASSYQGRVETSRLHNEFSFEQFVQRSNHIESAKFIYELTKHL